jgi:DNA-binding transcriptional LysR family regulator
MGSPSIGIDLRHLRYFLAVMEELHFGRAADRLHIAQPPLSQAIRRVEKELGVQLLHRTTRVVRPTEAGLAFAREAADVLASFEAAVAEARRVGGAGEVLRIGSIPDLALERLQAFLRELSLREPSARVQVTHLHSGEQMRRLHRSELEIGIFDDPGPVSEIETEPLFAGEPLGAFLPREHALAERPALGPDDLRGERLVTYPRAENPALHDRLVGILDDAGFSFAALHEASSMNARDLMLAVDEGRGVAVGPLSLASVSEAGALVYSRPLDPPVSMPDTVLAWRRNPPRHLAALLASIRQVAGELRGASGDERPQTPETSAA